MADDSKALKAKSRAGRGCLWAFGGIFVLAGGAVFFFFSGLPLIRLAMAQTWDETPCVIESSWVETFDGDDGDTYAPRIEYSYAYGDGDYTGDRYIFVGGSSSGYNRHQRVVDRYREGSSAVCYVNPRAPDESVLSRDLTLDYFFGFFGLIFLGAGLLVIFLGGRRHSMNGAKSARARYHGVDEAAPEKSGPVVLESAGGPIWRFIGMTFIALFWNGIVSVFVYALFTEEFSWFLALFLIPFVLVGIGLIVGVVYAFLAIFNPTIRVSVSQGAARLGSELEINWAMAGATHRIRKLRIWLEGREEASYTRGTDTYTDRNTFATIDIATTSEHAEVARGRVQFAIPEYTMHSFTAQNNKIVWEIRVEGEIARWPDVSETFAYTILPLAVKERA